MTAGPPAKVFAKQNSACKMVFRPAVTGAFRMKRHYLHMIITTAFAALAFLSSHKAQAECPQWTLTDKEINIGQSDDTELFVAFRQAGTELGGTAQYRTTGGDKGNGQVSGKLQNAELSFAITWQDGKSTLYRGQVSDKGRLVGIIEDPRSPNPRARWASHDRQATCSTAVSTSAQRTTPCEHGFAQRGTPDANGACNAPAGPLRD